MFTVNGNPILADELEVIQELRAQVSLNGYELFRTIKVSGRNIQCTCPKHNNGQERKPSCGISTVPTKKNGVTVPAGTVHCFTCGYTASLEEMVGFCFGKEEREAAEELGKRWLVKNFLTVSIESRENIALDISRQPSKQQKTKYVSEQELDKYRYFHDYMFKRGLTEEVIEMFDLGYDDCFELKDTHGTVTRTVKCITFPVRDDTGGTLFIARRSVTDKFFHYPESAEKPVYGLYELKKYAPNCKEVIVVESMFNCHTCWCNGRPAVALLGLGTEYQYKQLELLPQRKFITGFDPDKAGAKASEKLKAYMEGKKLVSHFDIPPEHDINDLTSKQFKNLEEFF